MREGETSEKRTEPDGKALVLLLVCNIVTVTRELAEPDDWVYIARTVPQHRISADKTCLRAYSGSRC